MRRLPGRGYAAIFDGSWYERVLADRVDGECTPAEWGRSYRELDQFERQLTDFGAIVVKFWLHVGADEQARRANASDTPVWSAARCARYEEAAEEMLLKTSTLGAPWTIVEANDAAWAEIRVLDVTAAALARELAPVAEPPGKKTEGKKPAPTPDEPVNYDIEDDPQAPTEVSEAQIDDLLRPLRPAAAECGKMHGVPLGTDIGVKMLLAPDGRLTSVRPTDRPAEDPTVQCILGLVKGVRLERAGQTRFTSALFDYSFKIY